MDPLTPYKKHTDVQQTWREHGWKSPCEDPLILAKWQFYQTLGVQNVQSDRSANRPV